MAALNGRYVIEKEIGKGGFSVTFLAVDIQSADEHRCVIKKFHPSIENIDNHSMILSYFKNEASVLKELGEAIEQIVQHCFCKFAPHRERL